LALLFLEKCSFPRGKKCYCGVESARRRDRKRYPEPIVLVVLCKICTRSACFFKQKV
jgi:hypothetical protein